MNESIVNLLRLYLVDTTFVGIVIKLGLIIGATYAMYRLFCIIFGGVVSKTLERVLLTRYESLDDFIERANPETEDELIQLIAIYVNFTQPELTAEEFTEAVEKEVNVYFGFTESEGENDDLDSENK